MIYIVTNSYIVRVYMIYIVNTSYIVRVYMIYIVTTSYIVRVYMIYIYIVTTSFLHSYVICREETSSLYW